MIQTVLDQLSPQCVTKCDYAKTGIHWSVFLSASEIVRAAKLLHKEEYFLESVTAIDAKEGYLVVYLFDHMDRPCRVALRVLVSHAAPKLPSIAGVFHGAEWHERETLDFYGIEFSGNPNLVPLLLPADLDVHPLQKEEGARVALADLLTPCEVVRAVPGFDLLTPKAEDEGKKAKAAEATGA
ncbi:NADH-quinone oxidoreductase subunit C [Desulfovibrio aminophilus]|nr:NADH-quinone oxidoreductase subunit C [Desulfovibrio aminophilus]MCM0756460.1 NADH-quinone oxidoreductase subunit C [Desulfovibrio aminophilus]